MSVLVTNPRRAVAGLARAHAQAEGITEGHGTRGRVSVPVVLAYLESVPPKTIREIGEALGVSVPKKVSAKTLTTLAEKVARNQKASE